MVNRLKKVISDIQGNPDFHETADFVIQLVSDYIETLKHTIVQEGKKAKKEATVHYDEHFEAALQRGKVRYIKFLLCHHLTHHGSWL